MSGHVLPSERYCYVASQIGQYSGRSLTFTESWSGKYFRYVSSRLLHTALRFAALSAQTIEVDLIIRIKIITRVFFVSFFSSEHCSLCSVRCRVQIGHMLFFFSSIMRKIFLFPFRTKTKRKNSELIIFK